VLDTLFEKNEKKKSAVIQQTFVITITTFLLTSAVILLLRFIVIDISMDTYGKMFINEISPEYLEKSKNVPQNNEELFNQLMDDTDIFRRSLLSNKIVIIDSTVMSDPYNIIYDGFKIDKLPYLYKTQNKYYIFVGLEVFQNKLLIIGSPSLEFTALIETFDKVAIIAIFLSSLVSLAISYILSRRLLKPTITISKQISQIDANSINQRIPEQSTIEYQNLSDKLNSMLERIEDAFNAQKQFVSDVSHELRTPLTSINGFVKMLKRWGTKDEKILNESIESIENSTEYLKDMVEKLLILTKPNYEIEKKDYSVERIIKETLEIFNKKGEKFNVEGEDFTIKTSEEYLSIILKVVIENALKYNIDGEKVDINYKNGEICIRDYGLGISEEDIEKIFQRFYKGDKSRSNKSHGLGLSIAKKLADKLNIKIIVENKEKGVQFTLRFSNYKLS
jgi:signal transduction histidine kinase